MEKRSEFTRVDGQTIANEAGVSVAIPGPFALLYRDGRRSITFRIDSTFALDVVLTYLVYLPEKLLWDGTETPVSTSDLKVIRKNVIDALKLFNGLAVFIAPQSTASFSQALAEEGACHVH